MARLDVIKKFLASKEWRELRFSLIVQRGCCCEHCGKVFADLSRLVGHHTEELTADNINNPIVTLNPEKIEIVCIDCHNKESNRFTKKSHDIYIVYGSPLSGKTTIVTQMMSRGDLIVDVDRLWQAVTLCPAYDKPNNVRFNVFALKNLLIDHIKTRYGEFNDAYIIGGYANKFDRERLADELSATLIYCESSKDECISRLLKDTSRQNVIKEWTGYIDKWWESYTE